MMAAAVLEVGVFGGLGLPECGVLLLLGLFLFGPERLPTMAADLGSFLRRVRKWAKDLEQELKADFGPELGDLDLRSLNPREFIRKNLLEDDIGDVASHRSEFTPGGPVPWDPDTT